MRLIILITIRLRILRGNCEGAMAVMAFQSHWHVTPSCRSPHLTHRGQRSGLQAPGSMLRQGVPILAGLGLGLARRTVQTRVPATGDQQAFEELAEWLKERGAYINKAL